MKKFKEERVQNNEPSPYKVGVFSKIPSWIKILLLKYWAAGAVFFFIGFGGSFIWSKENSEDSTIFLTIMLIVGYALAQEYIVKQIVRLMRNSRDDTYYYNLVNLKGTKSFFVNLLIAPLVIIPIVILYSYLVSKGLKLSIFGLDGIDPFTFALAAIFLDFIYLFIKNAIYNAHKKHKYKKANSESSKERNL